MHMSMWNATCVCVRTCMQDVCVGVSVLHVNIGPVLFETCEGDENMNTPQMGCSRTEKLSSRVGQSVEFHIALSQQGTTDNCFNQTIQALSLSKNISGSETVLVECSNISYSFDNPRLKVTGSVGRFSIVVSLHCTLHLGEKYQQLHPSTHSHHSNNTMSCKGIVLHLLCSVYIAHLHSWG